MRGLIIGQHSHSTVRGKSLSQLNIPHLQEPHGHLSSGEMENSKCRWESADGMDQCWWHALSWTNSVMKGRDCSHHFTMRLGVAWSKESDEKNAPSYLLTYKLTLRKLFSMSEQQKMQVTKSGKHWTNIRSEITFFPHQLRSRNSIPPWARRTS